MIVLVLSVIVLLFLILFLYRKGAENENYFKDKNVPYLPPKFIVGNITDIFFTKNRSFLEFATEMTNFQNKECPVVGMFDMRTPVLLLNDPHLINQLTIKEFDHFTDHRSFVDETMDVLFGNSLFSMRGQKWRDMRATLSPAFTGHKMRDMFHYVVDVTDRMVQHLRREAEREDNRVQEYEMKQVCSRFMNDVIAISAFGVTVNSFEHPNNEFFIAGGKLMDMNNIKGFAKFFGFRLLPEVMKLLKIQLFDNAPSTFFRNLILDTLEYRMKNGVKKNDVIDVLMRVRHGDGVATTDDQQQHDDKDTAGFATVQESEVGETKHKRKWTDDELVAQAFLFFLAGFDTSSTLMSFATYELALNPDIQRRLFEEISGINEANNGGKFTYDHLKKLKYLDMVVCETLRKWTPFPVIDRVCTKSFEYEEGDFKHSFEEGTGLWLNIAGIHNNPKFYPEPRKFDPERFSEENRSAISNDTYLPFGSGPRACIGSRFALMEVKIMLYYLLLNFELTVIGKTQIPLQLKQTLGALLSKDGIWVGLKMRGVQ